MTKPVAIAILGAGRWGTHLVRNFAAHPNFELVAVLDPSGERLADLQQRLQLSSEIALVTAWADLIQIPQIEAVAIATPAITHTPLITAALQQGYHVLAEKPLTLKTEESLALCQLAIQQQRQLVVDHTYLFHPAVQQGAQIVQSGVLGDLRYGYASRTHLGPVRQDVDALWDLAIHDISIFNTWLQETPSQVAAQGTTWLQQTIPFPDGSVGNLADLVWVTLSYPSGFQAQIHLCWLNPDKQRRLSLVGSQGTLIFDELAGTCLRIEAGQLTRIPETSTRAELGEPLPTFLPTHQSQQEIVLPPAEPLKQVCDHFWSCIQSGQESPISSGWMGAALVQILAALTQSLHQGGKPISVIPVERPPTD